MTVREIQGHLAELYGSEVSPDLISRVTDAVLDEVREWQNRPLDPVYRLSDVSATLRASRLLIVIGAWERPPLPHARVIVERDVIRRQGASIAPIGEGADLFVDVECGLIGPFDGLNRNEPGQSWV
jgi:hypothetical protein